MLRLVSGEALLFLLPFVLYAAAFLLQQRIPFLRAKTKSGSLGLLIAAGLGFAIAGLVVLGLSSQRQKGAYAPAHIEKGALVPGHME